MSLPSSRRNSFSGPPQLAATSPGSTQDLRQRVIMLLNKLSDRDTLAIATAELESIARTLSPESFSSFLSCIHNTDSSSKSPVRKQCVNLLSLLTRFHGDALAPFLSKMIATVLRRLRDSDSAVRSACVDAVSTMSSRITKLPFTAAFLRPLMDALAQEQDANSQIGAALCLAAAVEAAPEPDAEALRRSAMPRLGKLAKSEVCKAKAALLVLIGSVVGAGGASSSGVLNWLVPCLVEFLSSEDWAVRKAAAEALGKVATTERDLASRHRALCLDSLQNRKFDKVKVVRESMNRALEMWKEVADDTSEDASSPAKSTCSSFGPDDSKGHCVNFGSKFSQPKKTVPVNRSPPSTHSFASSVEREKPLKINNKDSRIRILHQQDDNKFSDEKLVTPVSKSPNSKMSKEDVIKRCDFEVSKPPRNQNVVNSRQEIKRALFSRTSDEKVQKSSGLKSRVVPCYGNENIESDVTVNNVNEVCESPQDAEDLSLIREQLLQIENQQSNLLDLLQRFIGSSQSGLNSLETRVNGLEMALDEISYDLAVSSGRIPNMDATEDMCCKLPGSDFLSSKFWKKTETRFSSSGSISSPITATADKADSKQMLTTTNHKRFQHRRGGFFVNPLSDVESDSTHLEQHSHKMVQDAEKAQSYNASCFDGISPAACEALRNQNIRSSV
ncbi:TORTIFOLIA1-like protein 4 [Arachis duranensis]|uniref:TORTIFOLIA1-like protein 4 n=1 Tax=Arachis duranensis TaxID=130453 RepID=A0A6P4DIR0_ARADU|nr:TORTIFOLIA1-like protein 4 [Arachis duranensis]